jgi:hypothetical protein
MMSPNKNVLESIATSIIASIVILLVSTGLGLVFHASLDVIVAWLAILVCIFLGILWIRNYQKFIDWRTTRLIQGALSHNGKSDPQNAAFRQRLVDEVFRSLTESELAQFFAEQKAKEKVTLLEFANQVVCEKLIKDACRNAHTIKILTIRGEKYFLGYGNLLYDACMEKQGEGYRIEVLVLMPDADHITEQLARNLGKRSTEPIKRKMQNTLNNLRHMRDENTNISVKCYNERPNFKILIFDDLMFVSSFANGGTKNDHRAKMYQITRDSNPLFAGFERYFDDVSSRSTPLQ